MPWCGGEPPPLPPGPVAQPLQLVWLCLPRLGVGLEWNRSGFADLGKRGHEGRRFESCLPDSGVTGSRGHRPLIVYWSRSVSKSDVC